MRASLQLHPDCRCEAVSAIEVELTRGGARTFDLLYRVAGDFRHIVWPLQGPAIRADELWRHTCFEAFLRTAQADEYYELNLSPSGKWAAYRFSSYRQGMEPAYVAPPRIAGRWGLREGCSTLSATLGLKRAGWPAASDPLHFGLSAVIEERNGRLSYWALAHPPGKPDFHHPACFALELPAAKPAAPSPRT
ncbi:MAG TPA: DOMON-like domain-containing protein [Allosphingosinicella sp.]|nr:DOMON-like domain-containing protein [Allosphingosinicella sp.]